MMREHCPGHRTFMAEETQRQGQTVTSVLRLDPTDRYKAAYKKKETKTGLCKVFDIRFCQQWMHTKSTCISAIDACGTFLGP